MAPIRVLQVVPAMDLGGMETFIMNVYRHIDREKVQFDFLYHYSRACFYDEEIEALGGKIYKLTVREDNNLPKYLRELDAFFAAHPEYKVVHGHYSGFGMFYNRAAKKHGVPVIVGHSHNTSSEKSLTGLFDAVLSSRFKYGLTHRFSCGQAAGRALYGKLSFEMYPNGIEVERFLFDEKKGREARQRLGLAENAVVYGHIGRFTKQKNHVFLLEIFAEILKRQPAARLLLAGEGVLEKEARQKAELLGIADAVLFAGLQKDTPALYCAMDAFLLPSLFEGFPVVLVEAQANGLPCFVSDTVSPEAALTGSVHFVPLQAAPSAWADAILAQPLRREDNRAAMEAAGYDVAASSARLQAFYLECYAKAGITPGE